MLERRLVEAEARIEQLLPLADKYKRTTMRSPENEARAKPYLDEVFKPLEGPEPKYGVACHGPVCKLDVHVRNNDWELPLQRSPGRALFGNMEFAGRDTYLELLEPKAARGALAGEAARQAFVSSPLAAPCFAAAEAAKLDGDLDLWLTANPTTHHWTASAEGSLAKEPFAACVVAAANGALASLQVPSDLGGLQTVLPFRLPFD